MSFYHAFSPKKRIFLTFLGVFFIAILVNAQSPPRTNWEAPPTVGELSLKTWLKDSLADAVVLSHDGLIRSAIVSDYYGFTFNERKRVKILKKSAFSRANVQVFYYHKDETEHVNDIKARTWLPSGRKIEVDKKAFATEKLNDRVSVIKFTFPQVTEGAVLEYEWEMESKNNLELREWSFQTDIPVVSSVLNLDIFSRYEYTFLTQGVIQTTKPVYNTADQRTQITFYGTDLPALREEAFISTMNDYRTQIKFQLSKYYDLKTQAKIEVLSDWERATRELNDSEYFGKRLSRRFDNVWKALAPSLTEKDTGMTRVQKIYDFVNKNIAQNEYTTFTAPQSGDELLKKGKGTSGDINLLLTALLREAGLEANPVLISTRSNGRMHEPYPLLDQFNHVMVQVVFPDKRTLLLDGGNALRPLGVVRESALNSRAVVIKKKVAEWIDVKPPVSSVTTALNFTFDKEGTLKGGVIRVMKGYIAVRERDKYTEDKTGNFIKKAWQSDNSDFKIDSIVFQNADNPQEALREKFKCTLPNAMQNTNDLLYLKPIFNSGWENNPFKIPTRYFPVDMPFPIQDQFIMSLDIPKGYKIEETPKPIALALPNKGGEFTYSATTTQSGNLQITVRIRINKTFYTGEEYPSLKKFFDNIADKLQEMVVLKKV